MVKQHEVVVQHLQQQVAELQQNSDRLTTELSQLRQENERLQQSQASARAQEQSAQERLAELAKANTALQQTLAALAEEKEIDQFLVHVLKAILQQSGAWSAYLFAYDRAANTLSLNLAAKQNNVYFGSGPSDPVLFQQPFDADIIPTWQQMLTDRSLCFRNIKDQDDNEICQEVKDWHLAQGHTIFTAIALVAGEQPLGLLGIAWRSQTTLTPTKIELIYALANQVSLAMQLTRLAEAAKQAAILKEQEAAARSLAKEQLKDSQRRLALLIQQMPVAIVEWNTQFEIKDWNPAAEQMFGYSRAEVIGLPFAVLVPDSAKADVSQVVEKLLSQQGGNWSINENLTKSGEIITCEWYNTPLIAAKELVGVASMALNITQRRQTEAVLQQTNEQLEQKVAERTIDLAKLNQALQAEVVERQRAEQVSRGQTEAMVKTLTVLSAEPVLDNFLGYVLQAIVEQLGEQSGGIWLYDENQGVTVLHLNYEDGQIQQGAQITRPDTGSRMMRQWDEQYLLLLHQQKFLIQAIDPASNKSEYHSAGKVNQQRGVKFILSIALSFGKECLGRIAIRRTKQNKYTSEEVDLACALAHQATLALQLTRLIKQNRQAIILEERNRLAYEIHDSIAQGLIGIVVQLQAAEDPQIQNPIDRSTHLQAARELAKNCLTEARRSVWALRPQALDGNDLAGALSALIDQMHLSTINFQVEGNPYALPPDTETNLLRIAQEALNNGRKHAQAQTIAVLLTFERDRVHLQVQDDGKGFDLEQVRQGLGITSMQMRAQTIGAHYQISSQPNAGTVVTVELTQTGA